jgi:hypothetical protein
MSACGGAITTINCANTESAAHEPATAEFEEAASQLEELGCSYEISADGVHFSRGPVVGEYDPASRQGPCCSFSAARAALLRRNA